MPPLATALGQIAIALGIGLLVGLERQRAASAVAGVRTFALVTLFGTVASLLGQGFGTPLAAVLVPCLGLVGVVALAVAGNLALVRDGSHDPGQTTEIALLVLYVCGAMVPHDRTLAVAVGALVAVTLQLKEPLHRFATWLGAADFVAILKLAVLSLVVLPVLPDETFGPYDVLNPFNVWLMIVLIVAIGLLGWLACRLLGARVGALLAGVLGGLISSTATTLSFARSSRLGATTPGAGITAALVVVIASAVVFVRILVEIALVGPGFLPTAAPPLGLLLASLALAAVLLWRESSGERLEMPVHSNPADLGTAAAFGAIYAAVLLAIAFARENLGPSGLYSVAVLSGLTDMDAVTLSTARLAEDGRLEPALAWRIVVVAALSNLGFKLGAVALLGTRELARRVGVAFGASAAVALVLLRFWP